MHSHSPSQSCSWGGDPSRFILMGHSAGAHSGPSGVSTFQAFVLGAQPWLGTVSLDSAAMDVVQIMESKHYRLYDKAFGSNAAFWRSTSPFQFLRPEQRRSSQCAPLSVPTNRACKRTALQKKQHHLESASMCWNRR